MNNGKYAFFYEKITAPKMKVLLVIVVALLSVYLSYNPLFHGGSWWGHDSPAHLSRLQTTLTSLHQGQFPPYFDVEHKDYPGYSWNLFYPPLYSILATVAQYTTADYNDTVSLISTSIFIIAFFSAFCLFRLYNRHNSRLVLLALCYACSLYLVDNLFIRAAFPESLALAFFPLLMTGIMSEKKKQSLVYLVLSNSLILLSNIPAAISALLFVGVYFVFHYHQVHKIKLFIKSYGVALLLSAWFMLPLFYTLHQSSLVMMDIDFYALMRAYGVNLYDFVSGDVIKDGPLDNMVIGLGTPLSAIFIYSVLSKKLSVGKNHWIILILIFFITATSVNYSFLSDILSLFSKIQFPWRLTPFVVLLMLLEINRNEKVSTSVIALLLLTTALISTSMTITLYQQRKIDLNTMEQFETVPNIDYVLKEAVKYKDHLMSEHLLCTIDKGSLNVEYMRTIESNGLPAYTFYLPKAGKCLIPFLAYNPLYLSGVSNYWRDGFFKAELPQGQHKIAVRLKPAFQYFLYVTILLSLCSVLLFYRKVAVSTKEINTP